MTTESTGTTEATRRDASALQREVRPLKRLYVVRVVREAYVLAEDEAEAADMRSEIERWDEAEVEVSSGAERLDGWEPADRCFVYHNGSGDITLDVARRDFPAA